MRKEHVVEGKRRKAQYLELLINQHRGETGGVDLDD